MFFTHNQISKIVVIGMAMILSGCASQPGLSFPISLTNAARGKVVSLKSVAQDGQTPFYQPARSVRTPQRWPQPARQTPAMPPSHPVPFRSHPVGQQQQTWVPANQGNRTTMPIASRPVDITRFSNDHTQHPRRVIRQVAQQQSAAPIVIQWDDHKQSSGTTRGYSNSTSANVIPQASGTQTSQMPDQFCPPDGAMPYTVHQLGDGCGDTGQSVDFDKINKLVQRVENMETELSNSNQSIQSLTTSLAAARIEISQMKKDADFWQSEVQRLERSMKAQHRSDIASLNQISQVLETLLTDEDGTPAFDDEPSEFDVAVDPFAPIPR